MYDSVSSGMSWNPRNKARLDAMQPSALHSFRSREERREFRGRKYNLAATRAAGIVPGRGSFRITPLAGNGLQADPVQRG